MKLQQRIDFNIFVLLRAKFYKIEESLIFPVKKINYSHINYIGAKNFTKNKSEISIYYQ